MSTFAVAVVVVTFIVAMTVSIRTIRTDFADLRTCRRPRVRVVLADYHPRRYGPHGAGVTR